MKARKYRVLPLLFVLISMLIVTAMPVAAAVDLRGVMDAYMYQNPAISETAILPYRVYLPDAIAAAFPKSADNVVVADPDAAPAEGEGADPAPVEPPPAIEIPRDREYGLLIWLHDEDLRGDDNASHIADDAKNGLMNAFLSGSLSTDYIILAPQCPRGTTWTENNNLYLSLLLDLVQNHIMQLPIDQNRILIGGISMGATAGYELIGLQVNDGMIPISAAYLVAGTTDFTITNDLEAKVFERTKVYAFLSENDTVTPPDSVRALADLVNTKYEDIQAFTYAVYPELGHEIWHQAFAEQALMDAFLATNAPAPEVPTVPVETEPLPVETDAPVTDEPIETAPVETDAVTDEVQSPLTVAGIEITSAMIAYVILAAAGIISVVLLITGLVKNNKVR
jgi:predicted esterase